MSDRLEGVEQGTVRAVVGAEVQRRQQPGHHPSVVGALKGTQRAKTSSPLFRRAITPREA
jgi:hypothetical protein